MHIVKAIVYETFYPIFKKSLFKFEQPLNVSRSTNFPLKIKKKNTSITSSLWKKKIHSKLPRERALYGLHKRKIARTYRVSSAARQKMKPLREEAAYYSTTCGLRETLSAILLHCIYTVSKVYIVSGLSRQKSCLLNTNPVCVLGSLIFVLCNH